MYEVFDELEYGRKWAPKPKREMPALDYLDGDLIVDEAWIMAGEDNMLVRLGDYGFSVPLAVARREGGRLVDEGDLQPEAVKGPISDYWALTGPEVTRRYRIIPREEANSRLDRLWKEDS